MNSLTVSVDYIEGFFKALNTFKYQLVFDPRSRKLIPLNPYEPDVDPSDLYYAGPYPFQLYFVQVLKLNHVSFCLL